MPDPAAVPPENPPVSGEKTRKQNPPPEHRQYPTGMSGNPGGRPKGLARKVREILGDDDGETLARFWAAVLSGVLVTTETTENPDGTKTTREVRTPVDMKDRIAVSKLLAERGWGKPAQFVAIDDDDPLGLVAEQAISEAARSLDRRIDEVAARRAQKAQTDAEKAAAAEPAE